MLLTRTIKSCATQRASEPPSRALVFCNLNLVHLPLICVDFGVFCYCRHFFQLQNAGTPRSALSFAHCPSLLQRRRWVSHWTHSSTVTRSTSRLSTGERWECVELNTVCCCWLYWYTGKACGISPLPKQLTHCGLHHHNATTNHTVTLVHQFHLTVNLQHTVKPQYCTYPIQVYHKLELEAFHCQFLKYTERFYITGGFRNQDAVSSVVSDLLHTQSLWMTAISKCVSERGGMICHVQGWELIVSQLTAFWYKIIYCFNIFKILSTTTNCLTTK